VDATNLPKQSPSPCWERKTSTYTFIRGMNTGMVTIITNTPMSILRISTMPMAITIMTTAPGKR